MIIGRWYFQGLLLRKLINRIEQKQELQGAMRSLTEHSYQTDVRAQLSFEGAFWQQFEDNLHGVSPSYICL